MFVMALWRPLVVSSYETEFGIWLERLHGLANCMSA